jgi:hypothetical protein
MWARTFDRHRDAIDAADRAALSLSWGMVDRLRQPLDHP